VPELPAAGDGVAVVTPTDRERARIGTTHTDLSGNARLDRAGEADTVEA
jgi:hypothetical protein